MPNRLRQRRHRQPHLRHHGLHDQIPHHRWPGADTQAGAAIYVPSGTNAACQGGRPVLLYAHGTSVQTSTDMANLGANEPRLIAAMFAAQGYIVVAPNYVGYAGSTPPATIPTSTPSSSRPI
jgi:acetyl esterase/lipase